MADLRPVEAELRPEKPADESPEPTGSSPARSELSAEALAALAEIGASHLASGLQTVAEWSAAMIGDIADRFDRSAPAQGALDWIGPHLGEIWEASQKEFDRLIDGVSKEEGLSEEQKASVKEAVIWLATKERTGNTVEAVEVEIAKRYEEQGDITTESVQKLLKMIVESGVHDNEAILAALHRALAKIKPEITRHEVYALLDEKLAKGNKEICDIETKLIRALSRIADRYVVEYGLDAAIFIAEMVARFGEEIRPCAEEAWKDAEKQADGARSTAIRGDGIRRSPVSSSAFRSVGYDEDREILEVEFTNGAVFRYFDVPYEVHRGLMAAESLGRHFHQHVAGAGYRYENVK